MPVPSSFSPIEDAASSSFHELMQEQTREGQDELLSSLMVVGQRGSHARHHHHTLESAAEALLHFVSNFIANH